MRVEKDKKFSAPIENRLPQVKADPNVEVTKEMTNKLTPALLIEQRES